MNARPVVNADTPIRLQMDVDDTASVDFGPRVHVELNDISGATATLTSSMSSTSEALNDNGFARVPLADDS
ncbi:MAG: hypothetical protein AAFW64_11405, partial [Pseudomonadota bacterium]